MSGRHFGNDPERFRKAVTATRQCSICGRDVRASMLAPHENRHRVEQQTKPCVQCGASMARNSRNGQAQWDAKRFCSTSCKGRWDAEHRTRPLSELYVVADNGCWLWQGSLARYGYGKARNHQQRGNTSAHRMVYTALVGPIPDGLTLDHLCRTPQCVNPAHLEPVTRAENNRRAAAVRTHCKHGHPLDGFRDGHRYCLTCHREREAARREARRVRSA